MSTDLRTQLAAYGDLFVADLDAVTVEDAMDTRVGEGKVKALEPVQRFGDGKKHRGGVLLAAAVFIIVVAAGLALAFALRGTTEDVVEVPAPPFETPEEALAAFGAAIEAGDYDGFLALFADGAEDFYGNEAATEQRKRERFTTQSLWPPLDTSVRVSCSANQVVDRSWTCTSAYPDGAVHRIVAAAGALSGPVVLGEMDISLAEDGFISRVSNVRYADTSGAHSVAMFEFSEWLASAYPDLAASLEVLYLRGDHESFPLPMSPQEIGGEYSAAVEEYVEYLEGGGAAGVIPVPPFETPEEAVEALFRALGSGDYEAFNALYVSGASNVLGDATVAEPRLRERFDYMSLRSPPTVTSVGCVENSLVDRSWTCGYPWRNEAESRLIVATELSSDSPPMGEIDLQLSLDGLIERTSGERIAGTTGPDALEVMHRSIQTWLGANYPELNESVLRLVTFGDPEFQPLLIGPNQMAGQWHTAIEEYLATLEE